MRSCDLIATFKLPNEPNPDLSILRCSCLLQRHENFHAWTKARLDIVPFVSFDIGIGKCTGCDVALCH